MEPSQEVEVLFVPTDGRPEFKIRIRYMDTADQIKEKIQEHQGIPVPDIENLIYGDTSLCEPDHKLLPVFECDITYHAKIKVILKENPKQPPPLTKKTVKLLVSTPVSQRWKEMEFDLDDDTVKKLKDKIRESEKIKTSRVYVYVDDGELLKEDWKSLRECKILFDYCRVFVSFEAPAGEKLNAKVVVYGTKETIEVEVNSVDAVAELRNELEKIKDQIRLPKGDYYFRHDRYAMLESESFLFHGVADGDTIEVCQA